MEADREILVSIITVVFNGEKYLKQTIESVINQTYKNIEYIIVDGDSTDDTLNIIRKYKRHISKWVSEPDKGLYDAMNKGIEMSNGELIGMINSDDWYEKDAVETIVKAYNNNSLKKIFHADRYDINELGDRKLKKFHPSKFKFKYYGMTYNHPSMFISKTIYLKYLYNKNLKSLSDYEFVLKCFLVSPTLFHYIKKPIVNYRLEGVSSKMQLNEALLEGYQARTNAGMKVSENIFSVFIRMTVITGNKIRKFL